MPAAPSADVPWRRIVVVGSSGAGKTTWARELARARGCRHVELDELFWGPGWRPKPREEFRRLVADVAAGDDWVIDGNYTTARDLLWPRAQVVVWLNLGFARVFARSLRRTLARIATREVLWHGNRESFARTFFTRESILWWVIKTHGLKRRQFDASRRGGEHAHLAWLEVRSPAQACQCLRELSPPR
jgi:adenylate kinase family enzyme